MLQDQIDASRKTIHADGYPMSVGELANLYKDGDVNLRPAFQRFFRWTSGQKSRLIESLLLGIPIPSIFISQREDGAWDVIDGMQRLSTIFEFMGILKDSNGSLLQPLQLLATQYLNDLDGKVWDSTAENGFTETQQRLVKRSSLDLKILKRESSPETKYELFQRLNTGGTPLSDQEVRNCVVLMERPNEYESFEAFSANSIFQELASFSDRSLEERYDLECATRWIVLRRAKAAEAERISDLSSYLTKELLDLLSMSEFGLKEEYLLFNRVMTKIESAFEEQSPFRKFDKARERFVGGFSIAAFEVLAIGLGRHPDLLDSIKDQVIRDACFNMWDSNTLGGPVGMGVRASTRLGLTLSYGDRVFGG